jgi:hypothetical protein
MKNQSQSAPLQGIVKSCPLKGREEIKMEMHQVHGFIEACVLVRTMSIAIWKATARGRKVPQNGTKKM